MEAESKKGETTTTSEASPAVCAHPVCRWSASTSNVDAEDVPRGQTTTMLGFASFLIAVKSASFITYLVLLIVSVILLDIAFFYTVLAFGIAEFLLIGITVFHGIRPTLKVIFCLLGMEMTICLVKLVFAILVMVIDAGKQCGAHGKDSCSTLALSSEERFYLFFFILFTAFIDGLIGLLTIANSPQMHQFEMGGEYLF